MKKKLTRLFSVLLAAVLVLGTLPVSAMGTDVADPPASAVDDTPAEVSAAEPEEASVVDETPDGEEAQSGEVETAATYNSANVQYKIVHLDCGRKYFSKDWIIALLYEMQNDGYNQLQLAFGNDGLRFLLNDMSFEANGTTYDNDTVVAKVKAGNKAQNSSGDESYLTQSEMDAILAKANELGIEIVPLLNLPGHANAILDIVDDRYNASGSNNTLNVADSVEAREFGMAIFKKYVDYFSDKGCRFFNFGADEYANDATGAFSFSRLNSTQYQAFVSFINDLAGYVINKNMTPRAFNDGFYYNGQNMDVRGNLTNTQVCYWSSGWGSYPVASASTISNNRHEMINTNGDFYYVLGKDDKFDSDYSYASSFTNSGFMGSTISNPVGSMFCIWCDYPNAETETEVAQKTRLVLRAMAQRMDNKTVSVSDNVVANGFNADGTINNTVDDSLIKISIGDSTEAASSATLSVDGSMILSASKAVVWDTENTDVVELTPVVADGANAIEAEKVQVTALKAGSAQITATSGDQTAYFSVTVNAPVEKNITVAKGKSVTETATGEASITTQPDTTIADVKVDTKPVPGETSYTLVTSNTLAAGDYYIATNANGSNLLGPVTIEKDNDGYYVKYKNDYYYPSYSGAQTGQLTVNITKNGNGFGVSRTLYGGYYTYYLTVSNGELDATSRQTALYFYTQKTTETTKQTTITFTGKKVGETTATIGGVIYHIKVTAADLSEVTPLTIEYWITNARLTGKTTNINALTINAADAYSEEGRTVADLVDKEGTKGGRTQEYWKNVMLDTQKKNSSTSGTELQTEKNGDDENLNGTAFTKVRYWDGKWQVYTTEWVDVDRTPVSVEYQNDNNATETYSGDRNQLVAYYMEVVDINNANGESELHVNAADWGTKGDGTGKWGYTPESDRCSVSVQLVYEDSTKNPAETTANALKSKTIVYGYWSGGRGLGTMVFTGANNYEIYKITAETGDMNSTASGQTVTVTSFTWDKNEEVVWGGDDQTPAASASIGNPAKAPSYTAPYDNLAWNTDQYNKNNAILIRVYVKAKATPDSLHVHYIDATGGKNDEFYSYNINVKQGTTFDTGFALENGALKNNTVENSVGVTQTVESDLTKMTSIGTQYRYSNFTCTNAVRAENGKDVYLYYMFNDTVSYVVDFGTPVTIRPRDVNTTLVSDGVTLDEVTVAGANHGTVETSGTTFTYTPDSRFVSSQEGETLTVTYTGSLKTDTGTQNGSKAYQVYIYPASNVLYEENFLTSAEGWKNSAVDHTTAQETQKVGDTGKNVFGYDTSYTSATNNNGVWEATGLSTSALTKPLTTNFYGNTFDLIGNCAPNSGRVIMVIKGDDGKGRAVDVDTRYSSGTIYQVPLAHVVMGDTDKNYSVMIYASGLASKTDTDIAPRGVATMSIDDANMEADDLLAQVLEENGLSMDDVEYVSVSAMDNASVVAADDSDDAVAIYANDAKATAYQSGTHVEIDGFRVYRSTTDDVAKNYPTNEQNVDYKRILDVVKGQITAYSDNNGKLSINVQNYEESGGPQNEIYLANGQSVFFQSTELANKDVQVSLRAVNTNATASVAGTRISLTSNTEMYYTLKADETGTVTIVNDGPDLLAIGNVKLPKSVTTDSIQSASEAGDEAVITALKAVLYTDEEPEVFTPETFTAKTTVTPVVRNKMVTLKVNVSSDVAYITVNGVKYTRTGLQGLFQKTRTIRVVNTVKKGQTKTYEVIAYNADGVASETITVTG